MMSEDTFHIPDDFIDDLNKIIMQEAMLRWLPRPGLNWMSTNYVTLPVFQHDIDNPPVLSNCQFPYANGHEIVETPLVLAPKLEFVIDLRIPKGTSHYDD